MVGFEDVARYQEEIALSLPLKARQPELALPFWMRWCHLHDTFLSSTEHADAKTFSDAAAVFLRRRKAFLSSLLQAQSTLPQEKRETALLAGICQHDTLFRAATLKRLNTLRENVILARKVQNTVRAYASTSAL